MEFDKSKVYTALNADELQIGSKVILEDNLDCLKNSVEANEDIVSLKDIRSECYNSRFFDGTASWNLAYLVSEPAEKKLKWTDLEIGDVITNGDTIAMVTQIDMANTGGFHIHAGQGWILDNEIAEWEKVEV